MIHSRRLAAVDPNALLARALEAVELAPSSPARATRLAESVLSAAGAGPEAKAVAGRALGLAAMAAGDPGTAARQLRLAARVADRAGLADRALQIRTSLVFALASSGRMAAALAEADRARAAARGPAAARLAVQRAIVLTRLGRLDEAVADLDAALRIFGRSGDGPAEARARTNRGVVRAYRGDWAAATRDLDRAEALHRAAGERLAAARVIHNQGYVLALTGDVPAALARYDQAAADFRATGGDASLLLVDRAEALLSVRLVAEGRAAARAAVADYARRRMGANLAEARLVLARAALLDGDHGAARRSAGQARAAFARQGRTGWAALAGSVALQAAAATGGRGPATLAAARALAVDLAAAGLLLAELDTRVLAATLALGAGRVQAAADELALAARARRRGPAELRARAWHAEALLRLAHGDRDGAAAALRAGIGVVDRFRASLGATDLQAGATGHGASLAELGVHLALEAGRPARVLVWAERCRASSLLLRPARPPRQAQLARRVADLRRVARDVDAAALAGRPTAALRRRQVELEQAVRAAARHAPGRWAGPVAPATTARLAGALADGSSLVEYVLDGGQLHAIVVTGGTAILRALGPGAAIEPEVRALRFALRRMALGVDSSGAANRSAEVSCRALDDALIGPLAADLGHAGVVVVPTGPLVSLPWCALPSLRERAVSVTPSASLWLQATSASPSPRRATVLVAGPGLPGAAGEITGLARRHPGAVRLTGRRATVAAVRGALDGAGMAHVAAHGSFRADNPLFSCLHLADGPLTVYDLEGLRRAPDVVVLSACDSALADVGPGDELLGLASSLLALGTRVLVATVVPVPDGATRRFMSNFHRHLRGGLRPAAALAAARRDAAGDPALGVAAAGFVCLGAG